MRSRHIRRHLIRLAAVIVFVLLLFWGVKKIKKLPLEEKMMSFLYPFCEYAGGKEVKNGSQAIMDHSLSWYLGLCEYMEEYPVGRIQNEDDEMAKWFLLQEGKDEGQGTLEEAVLAEQKEGTVSKNSTVSGDRIPSADQEELRRGMNRENREKREKIRQEENREKEKAPDPEQEGKAWKSEEERMAFYHSLKDFDTLKKEFYQIDKSTNITPEKLDAQKMLAQDMTLKTDPSMPQILIYHTHSQEAFADSRPGEPDDTVVGAGERLTELLRGYGFNVIHHTGQYDVENRDYAYSKAAPALEKLLEENPSIEVVIDLHRDGVAENTRLVKEIDGVKMAQFMFFNGLSHTNATGDIEYLKNPYIQDNLALSFQLQLAAREYYPGLARKIYLKGYRYNMQYRPKSILLELGAQTNTVEEITNTLPAIARILHKVLTPDK